MNTFHNIFSIKFFRMALLSDHSRALVFLRNLKVKIEKNIKINSCDHICKEYISQSKLQNANRFKYLTFPIVTHEFYCQWGYYLICKVNQN